MNDHPAIAAYRQLVARVDQFSRQVEQRHADQIACRPGCAGCCKHLTLFPVEAAALMLAMRSLPRQEQCALAERARAELDRCPLLDEGLCRLYEARPLICRTHGLPLLIRTESGSQVDSCPLNFQGLERLDGSVVLDLEALNSTLVAINRLFLEAPPPYWPLEEDRLSIARVLDLAISV